jgi:hypothetical protein
MPGYEGNGLAKLLNANKQVHLWESEIVPASTFPSSFSAAYQLERVPNVVYPWGLSFEVQFAVNPGAFEIDILGANTDQIQNYNFLGSIIQVNSYVPGYYVGRWDMPSQMWPKFVAAYMKSITNLVQTTLLVTR